MNVQQLRDYRAMMADLVRMTAYRKAIDMRCPGKVVCEIGVGLGPLSLMALQAGAERVYGIELDPKALDLATTVMAANGFGPDRFIPVLGMSTAVTLPERVDVILSETLDSAGLGENTVHFMEDARQRLLQPDGHFIPEGLDCYLALASPALYDAKQHYWAHQLAEIGLDYGSVLAHLQRAQHAFKVAQEELFSPWIRWQSVRFCDPSSFESRTGVAAQPTRAGVVTGFATAFDATLAPGVRLRTFPKDPATHWKQGFCPFPEAPIAIELGDMVFLELHIQASDTRSTTLEKRVVSGTEQAVLRYIERRVAQLEDEETSENVLPFSQRVA